MRQNILRIDTSRFSEVKKESTFIDFDDDNIIDVLVNSKE